MMKRIISLLLCLLMVLPVVAGCAKKEVDEDDKGAYVTMYLSDLVYSFDPAMAYGNEAALKIVSLMFDNLFVLNENGKVKKSLAKDYKSYEDEKADEYRMIITLNETFWSDGIAVTANDVVYSWKRILDVANSFEAAALLYDIKNARAAKEGDASIDDVGLYAINQSQVEIYFEGKIDYDAFLRNLTSVALAPLRENIVGQAVNYYDWAKTPAIMVASGPFKIREISYDPGAEKIVMERNAYYYRDIEEDAYDKSVTPYRLIIDYSMSDEEIMKAYSDGQLFFVGDIPLSVRGNWKDQATVTDALSTHTYVLNENAVIPYYSASAFEKLTSSKTVYKDELVAGTDGDAIFANQAVREAMSLAINREEIAKAVVFAKAATGLVPYGVFNTDSKKDLFRTVGGDILATGANVDKAKQMLSAAGVDASKYMFAISVPSYDEVHVEIAKMVQAAWESLGFHIAINAIDVTDNVHYDKTTQEVIAGVKDDVFYEDYRAGKFYVAAIDYVAYSVNAFSVLAPLAKNYTGGAATSEESADFAIPTHITGYNSEEYNQKIEAAYKATDAATRATLLHEAEAILMKDLPVIPIIFNQNATLAREEISKYDFTYYGTVQFKKMKLKDYHLYIPAEEEE
ncbi:MAG: hypothetical protein IJY47_01410 [Clostridia bacterium]|nr:hypothetical protein [Clostridia bacterium]